MASLICTYVKHNDIVNTVHSYIKKKHNKSADHMDKIHTNTWIYNIVDWWAILAVLYLYIVHLKYCYMDSTKYLNTVTKTDNNHLNILVPQNFIIHSVTKAFYINSN